MHIYTHYPSHFSVPQDTISTHLRFGNYPSRKKKQRNNLFTLCSSKFLTFMAEVQGIKLFGQTILLQVKQEKPTKNNEPKVLSDDQSVELSSDHDQENDDSSMVHKRPDKIIPCPRCKSMETKFCYFNNYNVNQPRHFCKGCQRYWTAGGALRNVPVGAGRRKSKPLLKPGEFSGEGCLFSGVDFGPFDLNGMLVDEWQLAAAMAVAGGFQDGFPVKRRRLDDSPGQTC